MKKMLFAFGALFSVFLFGGSVATAQYPAPTGSMTLTVDVVETTAGSSVGVTCTLIDTAGNAVAGAECTLSILSEPGDDATIGQSKSTVELTDSNGVAVATLVVGSTAGQVVVLGQADGFTSTVLVSVVAPPPASPISPPSTGDGGLAH